MMMGLGSPAHLYFTHFCRSDAGDFDEAARFHKKAVDIRDPCKPVLADIIKQTLGNDNSMSNDALDNLLQRSEILHELHELSKENNDKEGQMSASHYNLLTCLGNAR